MSNFRKKIDKELESMTFNELKNSRTIIIRHNKKMKRASAAAIALVAAAVLTVSVAATDFLGGLIRDVFPARNSAELDAISRYDVEPVNTTAENTMELYDLTMSNNIICDGNILSVQFYVTRNDNGEFTSDDFISHSFSSSLIFPGICDYNDVGYDSGSFSQKLSDDKHTLILTRIFSDLPVTIKSEDELYIKFMGAQKLIINSQSCGGNYQILDDGAALFKFSVPEIPAPIFLEFKNENGEKVFDATLTSLSINATAANPIFDEFDSYIIPPDDIVSDYEAFVDWNIDKPTNPRFLDENLNYTDTAYNGSKYIVNSDGNTQHMMPECYISTNGSRASVIFIDDPNLDDAKYIEWLGCIAEIPDMTENGE